MFTKSYGRRKKMEDETTKLIKKWAFSQGVIFFLLAYVSTFLTYYSIPIIIDIIIGVLENITGTSMNVLEVILWFSLYALWIISMNIIPPILQALPTMQNKKKQNKQTQIVESIVKIFFLLLATGVLWFVIEGLINMSPTGIVKGMTIVGVFELWIVIFVSQIYKILVAVQT